MTAWRANALARRVDIKARASLKLLGSLVAGGKVDEVVRRLAAAHALDVLDDLRDRRARLGERRRVRRDADARVLPQRIVRPERLAIEDIEIGVREMARVELAEQVGHDEMPAARHVDHAAVLRQQSEVAPIQEAARRG